MERIQNIFKQSTRAIKKLFGTKKYTKFGIYPEKDWIIIIIFFFCALVASGTAAYYFDFNIENGSFWSTSSLSPVAPVYKINDKNLQVVLEYFNQKEKNTNAIKNNPVSVSDPSL
jgi:hypothetical protein